MYMPLNVKKITVSDKVCYGFPFEECNDNGDCFNGVCRCMPGSYGALCRSVLIMVCALVKYKK